MQSTLKHTITEVINISRYAPITTQELYAMRCRCAALKSQESFFVRMIKRKRKNTQINNEIIKREKIAQMNQAHKRSMESFVIENRTIV